ncbi:O-methyltransferase [Xanthobacter autotrophicus]|uniref:O-methyltransferase n=1 Tax=Xanthobacter autotrophicus TaxID=280 RepID=UPI0024A73020|nr:O-methyltransferase [Xanthobacter autotrophicus]MDI4655250.1 O-methyltransferase [Xanthobacter autotrophicus]
MSATLWAEMDAYIVERLLPDDPILEEALSASSEAGLPPISVSAAQGQMLHLFARMIGAKRILEIGTLGGYSAIFLARALPADGKLVTLEFEPRHAEVARANLARAGLSDKVDLRVGRAIDTLPQLEAEGQGPFDLVFIDADKPSNPDYLHWALRLSRPGTVIICDNVVRSGHVLDAQSTDANVIGVRRLFDLAGADPRLSATAVQTVGAKGYDGFALLLVE